MPKAYRFVEVLVWEYEHFRKKERKTMRKPVCV